MLDAIRKHPMIPWLICGIGALFYCYEYLLRMAPSVMTASLMREYHLTAAQYGDVIASYYYIYVPMQLGIGVLVDRYGPRRLLFFACLSCTVGIFLFSITHVIWMLALSRFLIGLGSAFAFVGALKLATIWLPVERFAFVSGLVTMLGMVGAVSGDLLLTKLVDWQGWRIATTILGYVGIGLCFLIVMLVRDRNHIKKSFMYHRLPDFKQVLNGLWVSINSRCIWINGLIGCCLYLSLSAFAELWGVPYFMQARHLPHQQAAALVSMVFFGWMLGSPFAGLLSDFLRRRRLPLMIGGLLGGVLIAIVLYAPIHAISALYVLLFLFGLVSSFQVIVFAIGREVSPSHVSGTAIALTNMLVMMSGILFQPLIGILLDWGWHGVILHGVRLYSVWDYQVALSVLPIASLLGFVLAFFLKETYGKTLS